MSSNSEMALAKLDEAAATGSDLTRNINASFSGALKVARVATMIRQALSVELVREIIMPLKETDFGWRTDCKVYSDEQIRDCWVSATLVGAVPVNNEVNMISGRLYLAKNYFKRMIRVFPGLTEFVAIPGKLVMTQSGALVEYTATWKLGGKPMTLARTGNSAIPVRLNAGMGADGAIGKAERKILAAVFTMITGSNFADADSDDFEDTNVTAPIAATTTATIVQQVLPQPEKSTAPTQTQAVTERIKKAKPQSQQTQQPVEEPGSQDDDAPPWATGGDEGQTQTQSTPIQEAKTSHAASATTTQVTQSAQSAIGTSGGTQSAPSTTAERPVGFVKNSATGQYDPVMKSEKKPVTTKPAVEKPVATTAPIAQTTQAAPSQAAQQVAQAFQGAIENQSGSGAIEVDRIGKIAAVKAANPKGEAPYRILSDGATIYFTDSKDMAMKAKDYKDKNVPVEIEYSQIDDGRYWIIDVRPESVVIENDGSGEDGGEPGEFEQP